MFVSLANGLAERGHQVELVLCQKTGDFLSLVSPSVNVVSLDSEPIKSLKPLMAYLDQYQPDCLLAGLNQPNVIASIARKRRGPKTRTLISIRSTLSAEAKNATSFKLKIMPSIVKFCCKWADGAIGVSQGVADDYKQLTNAPSGKVHVVYNPVVTPYLLEKATGKPDHPWFQPGEPPVVLAVGHLEARKDFPTLIRAFAKAKEKIDCRLVILGKGSEQESLNALAKSLGVADSFQTPGFITDPYEYMSHAGVFVLSSLYEGLPGVLIQAMACGTPVVATDCPSGPKEVLETDKWGKLVPIGDVEAMADGIVEALTGTLPKPTEESWQRFTMKAAIDGYEELMLGQ